MPEAQQPASASAEQHWGARNYAQSADPVGLGAGRLREDTVYGGRQVILLFALV